MQQDCYTPACMLFRTARARVRVRVRVRVVCVCVRTLVWQGHVADQANALLHSRRITLPWGRRLVVAVISVQVLAVRVLELLRKTPQT